MTATGAASRRDLGTRGAIHDLVLRFYREIVFDELLAPVFEESAEVDWTTHIPHLIDYWARVLLREPGYDGFILRAHERVHAIDRFGPEHFDRWYRLFVETVDAGWAGPVAEQAKAHAARTARMLAHRVAGIDWTPPAERTGVADRAAV